jgi:hypothetical protein
MVADKFNKMPCKSIKDGRTKDILQSPVTHSVALFETAPQIDGLSKIYFMSRRPRIAGLSTDKALTNYEICCQVFTFNIPLGTFLARKVTTRKMWREKPKETSRWLLEMVLYPLEVVSRLVSRLNLEWDLSTSFNSRAKLHAFTSSLELNRHLNMGSI